MSKFDYKFACHDCTELSNTLGSAVSCGRHGHQSRSGLPATHDPGDELKLGKPTPTLRARLEKVRDELYQARDWYKSNSPPGQGLCHIGVTSALRMLEAILEGRET